MSKESDEPLPGSGARGVRVLVEFYSKASIISRARLSLDPACTYEHFVEILGHEVTPLKINDVSYPDSDGIENKLKTDESLRALFEDLLGTGVGDQSHIPTIRVTLNPSSDDVSAAPAAVGPESLVVRLVGPGVTSSSVPLFALPPDLLLLIVANSSFPAKTYSQLISLSHVLRERVRPAIRVLSFESKGKRMPVTVRGPYTLPIPDCVALMTLLAPLQQLQELTFRPKRAMVGCGRDPATYSSWIDRAFGGHDQLRRLRVPTMNGLHEDALCRILSHLPALEALRLEDPTWVSSETLLKTLAQSCPNLQFLEIRSRVLPASFGLLQGCTHLRQLILHGATPGLDALIPHLPALEVLQARTVDTGFLQCPPITELALTALTTIKGLVRPGCHGLTTVGLNVRDIGMLEPLWAQNSATLVKVRLGGKLAPAIVGSLAQLPNLREVGLSDVEWPTLPDMSALLDRLETFELRWTPQTTHGPRARKCSVAPLVVRSARLREFSLLTTVAIAGIECTFDCPALTTLRLPQFAGAPAGVATMTLKCPRLRQVRLSPFCRLVLQVGCPLDTLELHDADEEVAWLPVLSQCRDLRVIRGLTVRRLESLAALERLPALAAMLDARLLLEADSEEEEGEAEAEEARMERGQEQTPTEAAAAAPAAAAPAGLTIRLPDRLYAATMAIICKRPVTLIGPELHRIHLVGTTTAVKLDSPKLTRLDLEVPYAASFDMGPPALLDVLRVAAPHLAEASWSGLLTGAVNVRELAVRGMTPLAQQPDWGLLLGLIQSLPKLRLLLLDGLPAPEAMTLSCPQLVELELEGCATRRLHLDCPLLEEVSWVDCEELQGVTFPSELPLPYLLQIQGRVPALVKTVREDLLDQH
ncbi:hypothetical protein PAPYR_9106 [Paratrimastix pyriformis]|uniref:Uncharacterized protein n=1 Tax=Paratrimastix pyriformis TaxID=342808 RepID=A0ABQ8U998_9EUKA|nr:hypothetical protein PAPYR_9106 [Paratrimastix pyriformis]